MMLNMKNSNGTFCLSYENETDYFKIHDEIEDNFYKIYGITFGNLSKSPRQKEFHSLYQDEVRKKAHRVYYNSCVYSLRELLNNFKAIVKVYGDYLILDYRFKGVFLTDDDVHMHHCWFGADDEEFEDSAFNSHLLGEPLSKFVNVLSNQTSMGEIMVERMKCELLPNKQVKSKRRKRTHIPKGMRHEVFKRDNYTCCECGARKDDGATLHVDHIIPVSKGGSDELDNLQTLCSDCNLNKSDVIQR